MKIRSIILLPILLMLAAACSDSGPEQAEQPAKSLEGNDYLVTITTDLGVMKAILYDETPKHKENFIKLAREGFFNGLIFHRVINGFMIQGGDPDSRNAEPGTQLGAGGPGYKIPAEFVPEYFHVKGALSAARQADQINPEKASSGSQFYIVQGQVSPRAKLEGINEGKVGMAYQTLMRTMPESELAKEYQKVAEQNPNDSKAIRDKVFSSLDRLTQVTGITFSMSKDRIDAYSTVGGTPFLDDQYTVFGRVISGLEVIDKIASVKTAPGDRPLEDVKMTVTVEEITKADIAKQFGNPY